MKLPVIAVLSPAPLPDGRDSLDAEGIEKLARLNELPTEMEISEGVSVKAYFSDIPARANAEHFLAILGLSAKPVLLKAWKGLSVGEIFLTAKELSGKDEFAVVFITEPLIRAMLVEFLEEILQGKSVNAAFAGVAEGDIVSREGTKSFRVKREETASATA